MIGRAAWLLAACWVLPGVARAAGGVFTSEVLFWSQARKEADFQRMESLNAGRVVRASDYPLPLPPGKPIDFTVPGPDGARSVEAYMAENRTAGLLILQDGKVRLERYALGFGPAKRWTSFSVAKSITSTLAGAALADGAIRGLDAPATDYVPGLAGGAYDGVSVRHILTMTSGTAWNEDYEDKSSDVARLFGPDAPEGVDRLVGCMRGLRRAHRPGAVWNYNTGETGLLGRIVEGATKKPLADYLSEKIWRPFGMEHDAVWLTDGSGRSPGGCCLSATLRDYARFGLFVLADGRAGGRQVTPPGWFAAAIHTQVDTNEPGHGYGYQWWTEADGTAAARGIFGQMIHVDPKRRLVVAMVSAWPSAVGRKLREGRQALVRAAGEAADK